MQVFVFNEVRFYCESDRAKEVLIDADDGSDPVWIEVDAIRGYLARSKTQWDALRAEASVHDRFRSLVGIANANGDPGIEIPVIAMAKFISELERRAVIAKAKEEGDEPALKRANCAPDGDFFKP